MALSQPFLRPPGCWIIIGVQTGPYREGKERPLQAGPKVAGAISKGTSTGRSSGRREGSAHPPANADAFEQRPYLSSVPSAGQMVSRTHCSPKAASLPSAPAAAEGDRWTFQQLEGSAEPRIPETLLAGQPEVLSSPCSPSAKHLRQIGHRCQSGLDFRFVFSVF